MKGHQVILDQYVKAEMQGSENQGRNAPLDRGGRKKEKKPSY